MAINVRENADGARNDAQIESSGFRRHVNEMGGYRVEFSGKTTRVCRRHFALPSDGEHVEVGP